MRKIGIAGLVVMAGLAAGLAPAIAAEAAGGAARGTAGAVDERGSAGLVQLAQARDEGDLDERRRRQGGQRGDGQRQGGQRQQQRNQGQRGQAQGGQGQRGQFQRGNATQQQQRAVEQQRQQQLRQQQIQRERAIRQEIERRQAGERQRQRAVEQVRERDRQLQQQRTQQERQRRDAMQRQDAQRRAEQERRRRLLDQSRERSERASGPPGDERRRAGDDRRGGPREGRVGEARDGDRVDRAWLDEQRGRRAARQQQRRAARERQRNRRQDRWERQRERITERRTDSQWIRRRELRNARGERRYVRSRRYWVRNDRYRNRFRNGRSVYYLPPIGAAIALGAYMISSANAGFDDYVTTFMAPLVVDTDERYSLEEIVQNPEVRGLVRSVNVNSINFASGSSSLDETQRQRLEEIADAMLAVLERRPDDVFLIEGHTDAVGSFESNLELSEARAAEVQEALIVEFGIPAENLESVGYGEQYLLVDTQQSSAANRRVVIRAIGPLLARQ